MGPISKLFLPPPALSGCMLAAIYRDTRGAMLSNTDRINHFPASPLVSLTLVRHGTLHVLPPAGGWATALETPALPRFSAMPPQSSPTTSWGPAEIEAITIGIYPDAWHDLGGEKTCSRIPIGLVNALKHFDATTDPNAGWQALCDSLAPHWARHRSAQWYRATGIADWVKGLTARTAFSGTGQSLRSVERRMKRFSGQTRRTLEFFSAFETLQATAHSNTGKSLAEIAYEAGYSDQSHMGRAVRRATGFSPARLNQAIQSDEAFWCYRLLGERF